MAEVPIRIPQAGQAMSEGTIAQWLVADGAVVVEGQPLYVLETDKVEMEVTAPVAGVVSIIGQAGETHAVGVQIAHIATS